MAKDDELDVVLKDKNFTEDDWQSLAEILGEEDMLPEEPEKRRVFFNECIRHGAYGHAVVNIFRDEFEPSYARIVRDAAKKLKIRVREHQTVIDLEDKILMEVIESAKEQIIKEKGKEAWQDIEKEVENELQQMVAAGKIPTEQLGKLKGLKPGTMMAALFAGKLAGFGLYIVANRVFFAVARFLGWRIGVAVAGPVIGKTLAFLLGPGGWMIAILWMVYELGDTNWKKTVSAVVMIACLRRKFMYEI